MSEIGSYTTQQNWPQISKPPWPNHITRGRANLFLDAHHRGNKSRLMEYVSCADSPWLAESP